MSMIGEVSYEGNFPFTDGSQNWGGGVLGGL